MTKRKKTEKPEPRDIATDKTATLAKALADQPNDSTVTLHLPPVEGALFGISNEPLRAGEPGVIDLPIGPCPTCGTAKTGNRCEVCGHQEHDT